MSYLFCIIFEIELGFLQFLGEYFLNITYFLFVSCFDVCDFVSFNSIKSWTSSTWHQW